MNERTHENKKGKKGAVIIFILLISVTVMLIFGSVLVYNENSSGEVPVLILELKVSNGKFDTEYGRWNPDTQTYRPYIENISADAKVTQTTMNELEAPRQDNPVELPAIIVNVREQEKARLISYWNYSHYEGEGEYTIIIGFNEVPEKGDLIKIIIEINDESGDDMFPFYNGDMVNSRIYYVWQ